ncbi:synembryn-A isoform X1 [Scleropages formosus]|uniref:synembryn-A isoform X1 n=1 Tax=Scleropages formosus TaxID=113540 RepID=UPI0010FAA9BD|nr:synembryn-A-like isoform X1 [Scleropages formosus]
MVLDLERVIQCVKRGDQDAVQKQLRDFNTQHAECFFFDAEERERRKQRELEEFRRTKVRERIPTSDSDLDSSDGEDDDRVLRQRLAAALVHFVGMQLQPGALRVCLCTLRILSRERHALTPLASDTALLTLARLGGLSSPPPSHDEDADEPGRGGPPAGSDTSSPSQMARSEELCSGSGTERADGGAEVARGRALGEGEAEEEDDDGDACRKEALKALCNVIYSSQRAQERASALRLLTALSRRLKEGLGAPAPPSGRFYELRLLFLLTALRPELREQLKQERGVSLLTATLEQCLSLRCPEGHEVLTDHTAPPVSKDVSAHAMEVLKVLFNVTLGARRQEPDEEDAALYRHLAAVLRHCLLLPCDGEERTEELQGHTVNVLSVLPLRCLDVLLSGHLVHSSHWWEGLNMDCVHALLLFMDRRLDRVRLAGRKQLFAGQGAPVPSSIWLEPSTLLLLRSIQYGKVQYSTVNIEKNPYCVWGQSELSLVIRSEEVSFYWMLQGLKLKQKLTPVLNLLTESCRVHREIRHYLRQQILPPLRDVSCRPEQEATRRGRLARLMTHVDTDVKHCAAELLFVLCKENVRRFVKYTGYGNAAGLLAARGLLGGGNVGATEGRYSSDSDSDTEEYRRVKARVNLVTGRVEEEQPDPMEGMTDEEKEAEARRLVALFDRLSRDEIIQPVGVTAEGRLAPLRGAQRNRSPAEESASEEESDDD